MSVIVPETTAERLPRVSPSRLEAWDRCPAAYRFEYVLGLPQPVADQAPRLLGSVAHALVEAYVREAQAAGTPPALDRLPALARALVSGKVLPEETTAGLARDATELVSTWLSRWTVPLADTVGVEHTLAIDVDGGLVTWDAPDAFLRGRLDLVAVDGRHATVCDWKSGWATEDDEGLRRAWAPGCYAALVWAWAPRLETVTVEYHYLRTTRVARTTFARADAIETARLGTDDRGPHRRGPGPPGRSGRLPTPALDRLRHVPLGEPVSGWPGRPRGHGRGADRRQHRGSPARGAPPGRRGAGGASP